MFELSIEQREAVSHGEGPALIIAGPGSGKTLVIALRVRRLIEKGADPSGIVAVSFTTRAAAEMRERYLSCASLDTTAVRFGTFHSIFLEMLEIYLSDFHHTPALRGECSEALREALDTYFPGLRIGNDRLKLILTEISKLKNGFIVDDSNLREIAAGYDKVLHGRGKIDFDDMLLIFLKLIQRDRDILEDVRRRVHYILTDEFQDINRLQFELLRLIAAPENNIFAVGDDDQSIYGFRGSDPGIMLSFREIFRDAKIIMMSQNHRSQGYITRAAYSLIRHNKDRYEKDLLYTPAKTVKPEVRGFVDAEAEALAVKEGLMKLRKGQSAAVLYRTHRASAAALKIIGEGGISFAADIAMMTFHAAKGLEFDIVYIIEANDSVVPGRVRDTAELEEERRTFYVAVTRARSELHIFYTMDGYNGRRKKSRFIKELGIM